MATDNSQQQTRLQKLGGSDYEIVDGQPDIRGWDVKDSSGKTIGEVDELIFDVESRKVRYLIIDTSDNDLGLKDRDVAVPIGLAQLHGDDDDVLLPGVTTAQLEQLPDYDEDSFGTSSEERIRTLLGGTGAGVAAATTGGFYNHDHFNEDNLYKNRQLTGVNDNDETTIPVIKEDLTLGKREVETGGIRLRSRVVEEQVSDDINLKSERVNVERNTVDRVASADDLQRAETEIEMRERQEVPVVHKEARVVEEISLNKDVTEREHTVNDTVRNTEVDIDRDTDRTTSGL